jgi:23S rRNA pseudouridine1911/1915/1917 synthase
MNPPAGHSAPDSSVPIPQPLPHTPEVDFPMRACAWPPRRSEPREGTVRIIAPNELPSWIVHEDDRLLVISKPGDVVCHPSKAGPWSSLVGAAREYTGLPTVHLVFRLDRETSGIIVLAKDAKMASRLQKAMQERRVRKRYRAIVWGELREAVTVNQPLGVDLHSPVFVKSAVVRSGDLEAKESITHFQPEVSANGFTLLHADLETGRKHQIRAHLQWLGHSVVGDKIYGPDSRCYLDFIDRGWTQELANQLLMERQALHCAEIGLEAAGLPHTFTAPLPADMRTFCNQHIGLTSVA